MSTFLMLAVGAVKPGAAAAAGRARFALCCLRLGRATNSPPSASRKALRGRAAGRGAAAAAACTCWRREPACGAQGGAGAQSREADR